MEPVLKIQFKKKQNGTLVLHCTRADGSVTWQRVAQAFPIHDLTHYAVETVLGARQGFYGLLAQGWNITDFGDPWPHGPLPAEANWIEHVVGLIWTVEQMNAQPLTALQINTSIAQQMGERGTPPDRRITEAEVREIRTRLHTLVNQWRTLPLDGVLTLGFPKD